jgi:transcriptional regulator with XRE-family HTH domain
MTLAELAERTGMSASFISQVERGAANPTLSSLMSLAQAVGMSIGSLLMPEEATSPAAANAGGTSTAAVPEASGDRAVSVLRAGNRKRLVYPGSNIANELLSPDLRKKMEVIWVEAPVGSSSGGHPHTHEGEECGIVIAGAMRFWVGNEERLLEPRDAIYFPSHLPHRWVSAGETDLVAVWIITPPTF